jgi:hypothetical protein
MYGKFAAPTSVEFAPVPYFLENPSYLFEDRQKQLFVLTSAAAGLGKVPARWHVLSHAGAHAIQVFTDWLLERVKASYVEPFLSLRISDVGPLLPTENGSLFSPMYMPPAGDDPGVHWKGLRRCHRLKLGHLTYSEISKYIVSGMGRPTSLAPFKSLAKTERASYAYAFTRTAGPIMLDSPFLPSTGFARTQKNLDEQGLCILFYRKHEKTWLAYCSREHDAEPFGEWIEKKIAPLTMERLLKL